MSNSEEENLAEHTVTYVYLPDDGIYGTIMNQGVWASMIQYFEGGISYTIEVPNDEFIVVDEIGIGYISEDDL